MVVRYKQYLAGTLPPSRNEVVQLGFRLAKIAGAEVYSLDADGDFPYERLKNFAETRGFSGLLDEMNAAIQRQVDEPARLLAQKGVSADLRFLNDPTRLRNDNAFYRNMLAQRLPSGVAVRSRDFDCLPLDSACFSTELPVLGELQRHSTAHRRCIGCVEGNRLSAGKQIPSGYLDAGRPLRRRILDSQRYLEIVREKGFA